MNLDEAIKLLTQWTKLGCWKHERELAEAVQLGIEALKQVKRQRFGDLFLAKALLPGETPEIDTKRSLHHIKETLQGTGEHQ